MQDVSKLQEPTGQACMLRCSSICISVHDMSNKLWQDVPSEEPAGEMPGEVPWDCNHKSVGRRSGFDTTSTITIDFKTI